jgi:7-cyano-7-deazaguanine synthase in queuosine biosynthesis
MRSEPITRIRAIFPGKSSKPKPGELLCRLGHDVIINMAALEMFCFKQLSEQEEDLVSLAGVIAFADRSVRRLIVNGWRRTLHIVMPVKKTEHWNQYALTTSLVDALHFLTGDTWSFEFVKRTGRSGKLKQAEFALGAGKFVVMPYSNGLDSFSQSRLLPKEIPGISAIRLTAWNRGLSGRRDWVTELNGVRYRRVSLPVTVAAGSHPEQTFRTRSFMFSTLAGLAAAMADAEAIVIPEAGQGSLGPSLVPVGQESPHRGSHPKFSQFMMTFFQAFWGKPVAIRHPQLWRTKGEVLGLLRTNGIEAGWESTSSCSRDQRFTSTARKKRIQCGLCSGCLLRRMSLFSAGLTESSSNYYWEDLSASSLEKVVCSDARRQISDNDRDIAVHAVLSMEELARQGDLPANDSRIEKAFVDAVGDLQKQDSEIENPLVRLLSAHKNEWRAYTGSLGANSWINHQISQE